MLLHGHNVREDARSSVNFTVIVLSVAGKSTVAVQQRKRNRILKTFLFGVKILENGNHTCKIYKGCNTLWEFPGLKCCFHGFPLCSSSFSESTLSLTVVFVWSADFRLMEPDWCTCTDPVSLSLRFRVLTETFTGRQTDGVAPVYCGE